MSRAVAAVVVTYHEERSHDPVDKDGKGNLLPQSLVAKHDVEGLVLDLAEDGVHHDKQANGCVKLAFCNED